MLEAWHDAQQIREEALDLFSHGIVDLKTRAQIERLYWSITREINQIAGGLKHAPDEFRGLSKLLADKYFCNFSLFQSLPDSWAIDQIFPIMPIQRLDEKPDRSATLQDITCDSDGKIANFISTRNVAHYMPVHSLKQKEPYYVAVFLVGAYQEILGITCLEIQMQYTFLSMRRDITLNRLLMVRRLPKCLTMYNIARRNWFEPWKHG